MIKLLGDGTHDKGDSKATARHHSTDQQRKDFVQIFDMEKNRSRDKEINLTISTNNVKAKESDKWFQCEVCDFECPKEETL